MNADNWTEKLTDSFMKARQLAFENSHIYVAPSHLMTVLFTETDSLGLQVLKKLNANVKNVNHPNTKFPFLNRLFDSSFF